LKIRAYCPDHGAPLLTVNTRFYLMMDFVDGPTMEDRRRTKWTKRACRLGRSALSGMDSSARNSSFERCIVWASFTATSNRKTSRFRTEEDIGGFARFRAHQASRKYGRLRTAPLTGTARLERRDMRPKTRRNANDPKTLRYSRARHDALSFAERARPADERQLREMREFSPRYFNREISPEVNI
jgi:hypothetical protein